MIVEVKAQHSRPSPPYGSIQWRLLRSIPRTLARDVMHPHLFYEPPEVVWLFETVWVR